MHPNIVGQSSELKSANTTIKVGPGKVHSITILRGTTSQNLVQLRDGGLGGIVKFQYRAAAVAVAGDITDHYVFPARISFSTDIFLELSVGVGLAAEVIYD